MVILAAVLSILGGIIVWYFTVWPHLFVGFYSAVLYWVLRHIDSGGGL